MCRIATNPQLNSIWRRKAISSEHRQQSPEIESRFVFVLFTCRSPVSDSDNSNKSNVDWEMHTIAHSIKCAQCAIHTDTELGDGVVLTPRTGGGILQALASYLPK